MHRSVPCPDKNGVSCTSGSSYVCQTHTHSYPAAVRCANNNRGVGKCSSGRVVSGSDAYEHLTRCGAGHSYWGCNPTAVSAHAGHTKQPDPPKIVCPANSWTKCGGTSSHSTTCKAGHSYYSCNPSAVSSHKWHVKAGVNCPAHAWTNCNGATSHAKTCGRGHKYYTCNASAVTAHKWH